MAHLKISDKTKEVIITFVMGILFILAALGLVFVSAFFR